MNNYEKELNSIIGNDAVEINNNTNQVSTDITTFNINNRTINIPPAVTDIVVKGDTNSRIITFELNRYFDGVDLSTKTIRINYENSEGLTDSNEVSNIITTNDTFTFDWTVESGLTVNSGEVKIAIDCYEKDINNNIIYRWQTIPLSFDILDTIEVVNNAIALSYEKEKNFVANNDNLTILTDIHDTDKPIEVVNRTINTPLYEDIVVSMDNNSQIISFTIDRYFDGVDLLNKVIAIKYINALNESDRTFAVNVSNTDNKITFGWLIDSKVTKKNGYVRFAIEFLGYLDSGEFYCWSTKPSQIEVSEGLYVDDSIEQPTPSWLQSWQIQADNNLKSMELQLRINDSYVQWKHYNDSDWENLFSLNDIQSGSGVISYSDVTDKPTINSIEVDGAKTANDYNIGNGLNIDNSKVTYKNVEKLLSEVLSAITPINELNTESDSPVSTKAIMPMITPVKGDATGATYLDTNALPANTYRCYMPIDDEVRMKMGANKYRLRQGNILVVATSDTEHQLIVLSKTGFSLYVHTLSDNTVSTYRDPHLKPDDYDRYKSRYCYSDKKVDELLENIRELPAVTTSDNDKILKVVDGVWTAVSLANGDEVSY